MAAILLLFRVVKMSIWSVFLNMLSHTTYHLTQLLTPPFPFPFSPSCLGLRIIFFLPFLLKSFHSISLSLPCHSFPITFPFPWNLARGLESAVTFPLGVGRSPGCKSNFDSYEHRKCVWWQCFCFFFVYGQNVHPPQRSWSAPKTERDDDGDTRDDRHFRRTFGGHGRLGPPGSASV